MGNAGIDASGFNLVWSGVEMRESARRASDGDIKVLLELDLARHWCQMRRIEEFCGMRREVLSKYGARSRT